MRSYYFGTGEGLTVDQQRVYRDEVQANKLEVFEPDAQNYKLLLGLSLAVFVGLAWLGLSWSNWWFFGLLLIGVLAADAWIALRKLSYSVDIMNDGIIFETAGFDFRKSIKVNLFIEPYNTMLSWEDIKTMDFRGRKLVIETTNPSRTIEPLGDLWIGGEVYDRIAEKLQVHQQRGSIPQSVVIFRDPPQRMEKVHPAARLFAWVSSAAKLVILVILIAVGYPLYVGAGSLADAVAPRLVDIVPDAATRAITKHPEWDLATRIELRAIAGGLYEAPTHFVVNILGLRQNGLKSLILVPVFWFTVVADRNTQVDEMADFFSALVAPSKASQAPQ